MSASVPPPEASSSHDETPDVLPTPAVASEEVDEQEDELPRRRYRRLGTTPRQTSTMGMTLAKIGMMVFTLVMLLVMRKNMGNNIQTLLESVAPETELEAAGVETTPSAPANRTPAQDAHPQAGAVILEQPAPPVQTPDDAPEASDAPSPH